MPDDIHEQMHLKATNDPVADTYKLALNMRNWLQEKIESPELGGFNINVSIEIGHRPQVFSMITVLNYYLEHHAESLDDVLTKNLNKHKTETTADGIVLPAIDPIQPVVDHSDDTLPVPHPTRGSAYTRNTDTLMHVKHMLAPLNNSDSYTCWDCNEPRDHNIHAVTKRHPIQVTEPWEF